ncbi:hypothetical protein OQG81_03435 [Streptococcus macedonicus]|uniref:Uncharacterized protein n=1 Tax=Streptococcus macedonicus TaxID=59310 RepID=A0AA47IK86_STRMC|nr:hypothetical protein [Streptococcus macedonicus]WAK63923.1 hypothetical protein OQG81_03435 [Streptococcus macedonicus]
MDSVSSILTLIQLIDQTMPVNQNLNFHVYTLSGTEIYSTYHTVNDSFTDTINRSTTLTYEHGVSVR